MIDTDKRFRKVVKFYQSLPADLISEILGNLNANRDLRRPLSRIKSSDKKIEYLLLYPTRQMFSDVAYNTVKDKLALKLDKSAYAEIIDYFTDDNKLYTTIFFFRWCYEYGEDGTSNDKKYFEEFINSELFDYILNGKPLADLHSTTNNAEIAETNTVESTDSTDDEKTTFTNSINEVNSMKLLGRIEKRNTFYNFFPQFELSDDVLSEIPSSTLYPTRGGINLSYSFSSPSETFLEEIDTDLDRDLYIKNVYVVEMDSYDLEENNNDTYRKKLDLQKLVQNGQNCIVSFNLRINMVFIKSLRANQKLFHQTLSLAETFT